MKLLFLDLETTGIDYNKHAIIEISGIVDIDNEVKQEFQLFAAPRSGQIVSKEALKLQGLTIENLKDEKVFKNPLDVHKQLLETLGLYVNKFDKADKFFLIGYNILHFDIDFLRKWFELASDNYYGSWLFNPGIDVMAISAYLLMSKRMELENFKLGTVAKYFGVEIDDSKLHSGLYDVQITRELYYKIIESVK